MGPLTSDRGIAAVAIVTVVAAWLALPVPLWMGVGVTAAVFLATASGLRPQPVFVCIALGALACALSTRAADGVRAAPTRGSIEGTATLVSDPVWERGGVRAELRVGGRRMQADASGDAASALAPLLAGETAAVRGTLRPATGRSRPYLARRHIGARLRIEVVGAVRRGGLVTRFANQLRRTLVAGTTSMSAEERALFSGIVLGDDRDQSPFEVDDFRASGLSHLLAVSGQNVAFVLAVASPLLGRFGLRGRFALGAAVLLCFGVLTRWEPSVLRAVGMAGVALVATTAGRPISSVRLLALAVTGLVLIDPLLAGSIGFLLSVGACAGIAILAPRLQRRLPAPVAVTLAAQVGVAPVFLPVFGAIPIVSVPANLLALPAAGPLMMWGLAAGVPAGLASEGVATVLHLPTRAALWWIAGVAHVAARMSLPQLTTRAVVVLIVAAVAIDAVRRIAPKVAVAVTASALVALVVLRLVIPPAEVHGREIADGVHLWRGGGAVVLEVAAADPARLLEAIRDAGIRRVDVLVLRGGGSGAAGAADAVRHRTAVGLALAPPGHHVPGAQTVAVGQTVIVGGLEVRVVALRPRLEVRVGSSTVP